MARKKTREEKMKLAKNKLPLRATYSYVSDTKSSKTLELSNVEINFHKKEIRLIIFASLFIFILNILLYFLLQLSVIKLGFLGY